MAQPVQRMHPDLVRAPGFGAKFDQRAAVRFCQPPPVRHRTLAPIARDDAPAIGRAADLGERKVDRAFAVRQRRVHHAPIELVDPAMLERRPEALQRLGMASEQQAARCILIEPVHRLRFALESKAQRGQEVLEAAPALARTADRQACRLVDDQGLAIAERQAIFRTEIGKGRRHDVTPHRRAPCSRRTARSRAVGRAGDRHCTRSSPHPRQRPRPAPAPWCARLRACRRPQSAPVPR